MFYRSDLRYIYYLFGKQQPAYKCSFYTNNLYSLTKESRKIKMPSFNFLEENNVKKYNKINKYQLIQI
jgi:hypothetical protein